MTWQFEEAQRRLDEVADLAGDEGPRVITRHGKEFVLMSRLEYCRLTGEKPTFLEFLMNGPSFEGLDLERDRRPMRDVDL